MTAADPIQNVTFPSSSHQAHGYLALPSSGSGPGVIVIQEWWGLDDHIAGIADRLAAEGFVALAPDLYGGRVAHDADTAMSYATSLAPEEAARDLAGAVDYLLASDAVTSETVGAVGFCMGGGFVLLMATQQGDRITAAVPFYGVAHSMTSYAGLTADVQGHYAIEDAFYPVDQAHALEEQLRAEGTGDVEFFYYPAGHAFHNDHDRLGTYDEESAKLAWGRTMAFLKEKLG